MTLFGNKLHYAKTKLKWKACPLPALNLFHWIAICGFVWVFLPYEPRGAKFPHLCSLALPLLIQFYHVSSNSLLPEEMTFNSLFSEIFLLVPSLFSLPFSKLCVWRMLFETSNQECTLELAGNLLCFHQNDENYLCWNNFWWKMHPFFNLGQLKKNQ